MSKFKGFLEAPGAEKQRQRRVDLAWHGDGKRERLIFFVWLLFYIVCKLYFEEVRKDIALVSRRMDVSRRTAA